MHFMTRLLPHPRKHNLSYLRHIMAFILMITTVVILWECANPVTPVGGPEDTTPPAVVKSEPPLFSKNFTAEKVRIYFDEFVQFKDLNQQVIVSPPMEVKPEFKIEISAVAVIPESRAKTP